MGFDISFVPLFGATLHFKYQLRVKRQIHILWLITLSLFCHRNFGGELASPLCWHRCALVRSRKHIIFMLVQKLDERRDL